MMFSRWLMAISTLLLAACGSTPNDQEPEQIAQQASSLQQPRMANTAHCQNAGGNMTLSTQLDGSVVAMCQLANGKRF